MIGKIFKSVIKNFQTFLVIWAGVLIVNQLFIFHACFAPYCLIAAMPHTLVIAAIILYFSIEDTDKQSKNGTGSKVKTMTVEEAHKVAAEAIKKISDENKSTFTQPKEPINFDDFEDTKAPYCPKCGAKMVLKTAQKGKYVGQNFWGCSTYPDCNGVLNV